MAPNKSSGAQPEKDRDAGHEDQSAAEQGLTVVGLGASAGGLTALQGFFDAMPASTGIAFVVITHMDPERESLLPEILQQHTTMPVRPVIDMVAIEADHVYVISPNRRILISDTHLETEPFREPRGRRTPIDDFFRSLAAAHREAAAVIFSGGGTDGAVGIKAVKEKGGLLMVQEPGEAEHDSMPRAAIATGMVDVVLPAAELARKLVEYQSNGLKLARRPEALNPEQQAAIYHILAEVQAQTGHDFSQYKRSTILRRIQRRMGLLGLVSLPSYLDTLRKDSIEAQTLFNDLLIGVTNFFRDNEAWDALADQIIPHLFEGKEQGEAVRVWSIGCATGEEAYTLAMLLLEQRAILAASTSPPRNPGFRLGPQRASAGQGAGRALSRSDRGRRQPRAAGALLRQRGQPLPSATEAARPHPLYQPQRATRSAFLASRPYQLPQSAHLPQPGPAGECVPDFSLCLGPGRVSLSG